MAKTKLKPEKFYDSDYWQKPGSGRQLWNLRKMISFINTISNVDTPMPFFTALHKGYNESSMDDWEGFYASWNESGPGGSLTIECEEDAFSVYAFDEDINYVFYHQLDDSGDDKSQPMTRESLAVALEDAKRWLLTHNHLLGHSDDSIYRLFNLD